MILHASILSKLVDLAAIGCCILQIHDPSLATVVSNAVMSRDIEKRQVRSTASILSKLIQLTAISCCSPQIHDPSLGCLVPDAAMSRDVERRQMKVEVSMSYQ